MLDAAALVRADPSLRPSWAQLLASSVGGRVGGIARLVTLDAVGRALRPSLTARQLRIAPHDPDDPPWCGPDSASWRIHGDNSSLIGGVLALWLQGLHPLALAGVLDHSDFDADPLGRFHRTELFVLVTTYGRGSAAAEACRHVRDDVHPRIVGTAADGRPYAASDPELLDWIHCALLLAVGRSWVLYGHRPDPGRLDDYVAEQARVPIELGDPDPPRTWRQLLDRVEAHRPQLAVDERTAVMDRWLRNPPLPGRLRLAMPVYWALHGAAMAAAPEWALQLWRRPRPRVEPRIIGSALTATAGALFAA